MAAGESLDEKALPTHLNKYHFLGATSKKMLIIKIELRSAGEILAPETSFKPPAMAELSPG